jgi:hypothetical protein
MSWDLRSSTGQCLQPWYRAHLFVKQGAPGVIAAERARIRTLDWKPPAKIGLTACMLCVTRPIERVGNQAMLRNLGLATLADMANHKLAQQLEAIP